MKYIFALILFGLAVTSPVIAQNSRIPKPPPLQPVENLNSEHFTEGVNTPGSDYHREEILPEGSESPIEPSPNVSRPNFISSIAQNSEGALFYSILILVCAVCFLLLLAWIVYRYRIKDVE